MNDCRQEEINTVPPEADQNQEMLDFALSHFSTKRSLNSNLGMKVLWDTSLPSSGSMGFLNKVAIPCPKKSSLDFLACQAVSRVSGGNLVSVTSHILSSAYLRIFINGVICVPSLLCLVSFIQHCDFRIHPY